MPSNILHAPQHPEHVQNMFRNAKVKKITNGTLKGENVTKYWVFIALSTIDKYNVRGCLASKGHNHR
jgi:AMMECR1 domain-containing protein